MKNRSTFVLLLIFFAGLLGFWWVDRSGIPTASEIRRMTGRILPTLEGVALRDIRRLTIEGGAEPLEFRRDDRDRWRMVSPIDVPAASAKIDALLSYLKVLRRLGDAGKLQGNPSDYGLDRPARTLTLYPGEGRDPLAAIELGRVSQDRRYVRSKGEGGAEVVELSMLDMADQPRDSWRERSLFQIAAYDAAGITLEGPTGRLQARREGGRWRLVEPIRAPADLNKLDGLLADLAGLQVLGEPGGFVTENAADFALYGLDPPYLIITVDSVSHPDRPQVVRIGSEPPGKPGRALRARGDDCEIVIVPGRALAEAAADPYKYRTSLVTDLDPAKVDRLRVESGGVRHLLQKTGGDWKIAEPSPGPADPRVVADLIARVAELQAMQFVDPTQVRDPGTDGPGTSIRIWEEGSESPILGLTLGRQDAAAKAIYAKIDGDSRLAALPEAFGDVIPRGPMAFRERAVINLGPGRIDRIERVQDGLRVAIEAPAAPASPADYVRWRMTVPVEAPVDPENTARLGVLLGGMRAENLIESGPADLAPYGLDRPGLAVAWSARPAARNANAANPGASTGRLLVGKPSNRAKTSRYAMIEGQPLVFTLESRALAILEAELRNRRIMSFPPDRARRLELDRSGEVLAWTRSASAPGLSAPWAAESNQAGTLGVVSTQLDALVENLGRLVTPRFLQYEGPFPAYSSLNESPLTVRVKVESELEPRVLRLGSYGPEPGTLHATTSAGDSGPVFLVPAAPFQPWMPPPNLPENPFEPEGRP
ncbi:MAG: DUF4340 domain-containing protein [Isosphaeraceae bacterium]